MNWKTFLSSSGLALAASLGLLSCEKTDTLAALTEPEALPEAPAQPAAEQATAPDADRLLARTAARWQLICNGDWIQAYDYLPKELKSFQKLSTFLQGKEEHQYRNPGKPQLVGIEGDRGYVELEVVWTPLHDILKTATNAPPEGMTQMLRVVETYLWQDGDWYWHVTERRNDFFREHPELVARRDAPEGE